MVYKLPRAISKFANKVLRYKVGRMKVDSAKGYVYILFSKWIEASRFFKH